MELSDLAEENKWYNHGVQYLEASLGIDLTIIEKARFRELVRDSIRRNQEIEGHWAKMCLGHEAIGIFLHDNYGVPYPAEYPDGSMSHDWLVDRWKFRDENGYDGYAEFWRKIQEESHMP